MLRRFKKFWRKLCSQLEIVRKWIQSLNLSQQQLYLHLPNSLSAESNTFLYSTTTESKSSLASCSSNMSSRSGQGKLWKKSELREESICIKFQHGSCTFNDDHRGNSHLCARCYFSKHMLIEPDHGSDWCQEDLSWSQLFGWKCSGLFKFLEVSAIVLCELHCFIRSLSSIQ